MISTRHRFIFLHVPKTAGNAVQTYLLPHSDDQKVVHRHQDGIERFDVRGQVTPTKHATLQQYFEAMGGDLDGYSVILPIRDPLDRALSLYFSPHRAAGRPAGFMPVFDQRHFDALVASTPSMADYLRVGSEPRQPAFILRFENLEADLGRVAAHFGLPAPKLPVLNRSLDQAGERGRLRSDPAVVASVRHRFAEDYALFSF
ncbi:MAG TPA: sulfotransferase family 2 domain-containing protein [Devosiaceae bacterium]|nr:sulfotransferase family 2 domain-containing protein [Devosiaceae bacterium]